MYRNPMVMMARTRLCFDFQCPNCGLLKHVTETDGDHLIVPEHSAEECEAEFRRMDGKPLTEDGVVRAEHKVSVISR